MNATNMSAIVIAAIALMGIVAAIAQWFYRRGGQEKSFADAIKENTVANRELTAELRDFKEHTVSKLQNHEVGITVLESTSK